MVRQLGDFRGWHLSVARRRCQLQRLVLIDDLLARYGRGQKISAMANRLRCLTPGRGYPPSSVTIANTAQQAILVHMARALKNQHKNPSPRR